MLKKIHRLSTASAEKCLTVLKTLKNEIHMDQSKHNLCFPSVSDMKWRVDITISSRFVLLFYLQLKIMHHYSKLSLSLCFCSSTLSRVLEPNIVMELELSDGQKVTFELSVSKFHKLRYTVASILKDMDAMNNKMSAVKI